MSPCPTRLLLATDGSGESNRAAQMACELSGNLRSELHLVYAWPAPDADSPAPRWATLALEFEQGAYELAEKEAKTRLAEQVRSIEESGGSVAENHLRPGSADAEIASLAEELSAGLIVVGSRGLGAMKRALMGSVSTSVVRHAHCSVLVVKLDERSSEASVGGFRTEAVMRRDDARVSERAVGDGSVPDGVPF